MLDYSRVGNVRELIIEEGGNGVDGHSDPEVSSKEENEQGNSQGHFLQRMCVTR